MCLCLFFSRSYLLIAADGKCKNADHTDDGEEGPSRHQQGVNGDAHNVVHGKDEKDALHTCGLILRFNRVLVEHHRLKTRTASKTGA